jgi:flagellar hook-length control protein FliK
MPSQTGTAFTSANGSAPSQAPAAASTQAALTSDTDDAAAKLATTASTVTAIPTEKTDAGESSQDRITEAMAPGKSVESAAPSAMGHSGGNRDATPQHGEPEARGHNASPEPLMTSRAVAFAAAMTLVSSPDGTLRITSLPSAPPTLASLLPEESRANLDSMVQTMRVMVRDTVSEATLHLRPEHFGEVTIQVRVDGKSVSAIINTESPGVREWLQAQESTIRNGLSEHGLHLERLLVQRDGRHERRQQAPQQQGAKRRRTRDDADAQQTFEISV